MTHDTLEVQESGVRDALGVMFKGPIGTRDAQGIVRVHARERPATLLYGPFWHLTAGRWRLRISCRTSGRPDTNLACLAVEVIADNRFICVARDFTPDDCASGGLQLSFVVTPEMSESTQFSRFEFVLRYLGHADLTIKRVDIEPIDEEDEALPKSLWRILPRLRPTILARQAPDGTLVARTRAARGELARLLRPRVRLPSGDFALSLRFGMEHIRDAQRPFARIALTAGQTQLLLRDLLASDLDGDGHCELRFRVPRDLGVETGNDVNLGCSLRQAGNGSFELRSVDISPTCIEAEAAPAVPRLAIRSSAVKVVIVGNCQAEVICNGFRRAFTLKRFEPKFHFVRMSPLYLDQARRDLAECDVLFVQAIGDWEDYPLRDEVAARTEVVRFPCLRFASPWPFDSSNGPMDALAVEKEGENRVFPHLDGRLARLRAEIPDPEARFAAYAALSPAESSHIERLARYETRRLEAMDREFESGCGTFILENFRTSRVFHATGHPGEALFARLMNWMARRAGHGWLWTPRWRLHGHRDLQVPVHPEVARLLGMRWATSRTLYGARGLKTDWETYIRAYIRHYG